MQIPFFPAFQFLRLSLGCFSQLPDQGPTLLQAGAGALVHIPAAFQAAAVGGRWYNGEGRGDQGANLQSPSLFLLCPGARLGVEASERSETGEKKRLAGIRAALVGGRQIRPSSGHEALRHGFRLM